MSCWRQPSKECHISLMLTCTNGNSKTHMLLYRQQCWRGFCSLSCRLVNCATASDPGMNVYKCSVQRCPGCTAITPPPSPAAVQGSGDSTVILSVAAVIGDEHIVHLSRSACGNPKIACSASQCPTLQAAKPRAQPGGAHRSGRHCAAPG